MCKLVDGCYLLRANFCIGVDMIEQIEQVLRLSVDIICAYLSNHTVAPTELPVLIDSVSATLGGLAGSAGGAGPVAPALTAAQIRKSITPDYIVCFENGRSYRSLTRHLRAAYGLTPEDYRAKWRLPPDYPMVAPNYAAMRSQLARNTGLGSARPRSRGTG